MLGLCRVRILEFSTQFTRCNNHRSDSHETTDSEDYKTERCQPLRDETAAARSSPMDTDRFTVGTSGSYAESRCTCGWGRSRGTETRTELRLGLDWDWDCQWTETRTRNRLRMGLD